MKKLIISLSTIFLLNGISFLNNKPSFENQKQEKIVKRAKSNERNLVIYNCADYIDETLIKSFEREYNCKVDYFTYDTNETMYNQFTLQPEGTYDLICTSDYMLQRMIRENLVEPLNIKEEVPVYDKYASREVRSKLANMYADTDGDGVKDSSLDNYVAGYMWGTLGVIYDPYCSDTIREDVKSWNIFWDSKYENLISIKNSMRDTFVVGLMHAHKGSDITNLEDILTPAREKYLSSLEAASSEEERVIIRKEYNDVIQNLFDLVITSEDHSGVLEIVKQELISLKKNIFGFEVDSGKNDIITGKIKMNLAWSGDAVYSIEEGSNVGKTLEYYVPEDGGNVWYDGWVLPKGSNRELACAFIDYISNPENAAINMEYIGYTSFIASDEIFDMISSWYGIADYNEATTYYGPYISKEDGKTEEVEGSYVHYNNKFYTCILQGNKNEPSEVEGISPLDETVWMEVDEEELDLGDQVDVSFLFKGNMQESRNAIIYPYADCKNRLLTQYPDQDTLARCAIMNDFESANDDVVIMWGQLRAYTNMTPYYVFLISIGTIVIVSIVYNFIKKRKSSRNKRRLAKL